jgi:hypothetical protein
MKLTEEQANFLGFILNSYNTSKIKPEAVAKLRLNISRLSLVLKVAKGEMTEDEIEQMKDWLGN